MIARSLRVLERGRTDAVSGRDLPENHSLSHLFPSFFRNVNLYRIVSKDCLYVSHRAYLPKFMSKPQYKPLTGNALVGGAVMPLVMTEVNSRVSARYGVQRGGKFKIYCSFLISSFYYVHEHTFSNTSFFLPVASRYYASVHHPSSQKRLSLHLLGFGHTGNVSISIVRTVTGPCGA